MYRTIEPRTYAENKASCEGRREAASERQSTSTTVDFNPSPEPITTDEKRPPNRHSLAAQREPANSCSSLVAGASVGDSTSVSQIILHQGTEGRPNSYAESTRLTSTTNATHWHPPVECGVGT